MSQNNNDDSYGYGVDIGYEFKPDGSVDFKISDSGDIALVGGDGDDPLSQRRKNAIQQIILRIITPFGGITDQGGNAVPFGSEIQSMIGAKNTSINRHVMKAYILTCLQDYQALEAILNIDVHFTTTGACEIKLMLKLKDDDKILYETITIGGT